MSSASLHLLPPLPTSSTGSDYHHQGVITPDVLQSLLNGVTSEEIQSNFDKYCLILPLVLVPDNIKNNHQWLLSWVEYNRDRTVFENGNDVYHYKFTYWSHNQFLRPNINDDNSSNERIEKLEIYLQERIMEEYHWNVDLTLASSVSYNYHDNVKVGQWKTYYSNGYLKDEFQTHDDIMHGLARSYCPIPGNKLQMKGKYKEGNLNGQIKKWDQNGKLINKINYKDGIEDGDFEFWSETQGHYVLGFYKNGKASITGKRQ